MGLVYAWGALRGYMFVGDYNFSETNYIAQGLNSISSDLSLEQDAAAVYYGGIARMPSSQQFEELLEFTAITFEDGIYSIRSNINDMVIRVYARGEFITDHITNQSNLYFWTRDYISSTGANCFTINSSLSATIIGNVRSRGLLILPVKSY